MKVKGKSKVGNLKYVSMGGRGGYVGGGRGSAGWEGGGKSMGDIEARVECGKNRLCDRGVGKKGERKGGSMRMGEDR